MSVRPLRIAAALRLLTLAVPVLVAGCYDATPHDHQLLCDSLGRCPASYHCADDFTCYQNGHDPVRPDLGGLEATPDLAMVSVPEGLDASIDSSNDAARSADLATRSQPDLVAGRDR